MSVMYSRNIETVEAVAAELKQNGGYCPCKLEQNPDTKCPCLDFRELEQGECDCGLYVKTI